MTRRVYREFGNLMMILMVINVTRAHRHWHEARAAASDGDGPNRERLSTTQNSSLLRTSGVPLPPGRSSWGTGGLVMHDA